MIDCEYINCPLCGTAKSQQVASGYDYQYRVSEKKFFFVQCNSCRHVYLNPVPVRKSVPFLYPDNYYTKTGRHSGSSVISWFKKKVVYNRIKGLVNAEKKMSVLEIGCGDCSFLLAIKAKKPDFELTGIDLFLTDASKEKCKKAGITLIEGNVESFIPDGEKYDLILMNQLIEHLRSPGDVLTTVYGLLRENGRLSIETPDISGYDRKIFPKTFWGGYYFPRHFHLFDFLRLSLLLQEKGFVVEQHYSLLAPVIWAYSMDAFLHGRKKANKTSLVFSDKNPLCLAFFTVLDIMVKYFIQRNTSNQKVVAIRKKQK